MLDGNKNLAPISTFFEPSVSPTILEEHSDSETAGHPTANASYVFIARAPPQPCR